MPYDKERGGITTVKKNMDINVYHENKARLKYIFEHFENIYVSFSGEGRRTVSCGRPDIPSAPERPVPAWSAPCCPGRGWRRRRVYDIPSGACHSPGR